MVDGDWFNKRALSIRLSSAMLVGLFHDRFLRPTALSRGQFSCVFSVRLVDNNGR